MIRLTELMELSTRLFPDTKPTLISLLTSWARVDPEREFACLLKDTGLGTHQFAKALEPMNGTDEDDDKHILFKTISTSQSDPATGNRLLRCLTDSPTHRVCSSLTAAGLNIERLRRNLNASRELEIVMTAPLESAPAGLKTILKYGRDLTALAVDGAFDGLCDRPLEIQRLLDVLERMTKGNPVLTGDAGVGKTALVELLGLKLAQEAVPGSVKSTRLIEVSMNKVLAGTKYRGEFEQRMEDILKAGENLQPCWIFIDEFHLIWGAGRAEGVIGDASQILKPYLAGGEPRFIGATTSQEYHRWITQDPALERRFEEVLLAHPDRELTRQMVKSQASGLAAYHGVAISDPVIDAVISLTDQHERHRQQPDKSVDLLDRTAVVVARKNGSEITLADLREKLGLTTHSGAELSDLAKRLQARVIGQKPAIETVSDVLLQHSQGLGVIPKTLGNFLFAGETGVGKTELARAIAAEFYRNAEAMLHVDLSLYSERHQIATLIGSPPGYRDGDRQGILFEWFHANRAGVILLDEFEKAHEKIQLMWLGALDEGRISDAKGREIDLAQCVVVFTTNAVKSRDLNRQSPGFRASARPESNELLGSHFPAELLGRTHKVIFNSLSDDDSRTIIRLRLDEMMTSIRSQGHSIEYAEDRLVEFLFNNIGTMDGGARDIKRLIDKLLLQPISRALATRNEPSSARFILDDDFYLDGRASLQESKGWP